MKKIKLLAILLFSGSSIFSQTLSNGSFETVSSEPSCGNNLEVLFATGWSGIRDTYSWLNCASHTGTLSTASWVLQDPALYLTGMGGGCVPTGTGARTGTHYVVLETTSGTSARNELIMKQVTGLTVGNQYTFTTYIDPVQSFTAAQLADAVDFILTSSSSGQNIVNDVLAAQNQANPIVNAAGANWFKVERMLTATATSMNLVFGYMLCNDAGSLSISVDDFSVSSNCLANAGPDQTYVCSCCINQPCESKVIGTPAITGLTYSWSPTTNLNNPSLAQPTANPNSVPITYTVTVSGSNCTTSSDAMVMTRVLGGCCPIKSTSYEDEEFDESMITVFPNPSTDGIINISLDTHLDIVGFVDVYDMLGKHVITENITKNKHRIDVNSYGPGCYTIIMNINGKSYQNKVVVQ